jgi:hypothetical protein
VRLSSGFGGGAGTRDPTPSRLDRASGGFAFAFAQASSTAHGTAVSAEKRLKSRYRGSLEMAEHVFLLLKIAGIAIVQFLERISPFIPEMIGNYSHSDRTLFVRFPFWLVARAGDGGVVDEPATLGLAHSAPDGLGSRSRPQALSARGDRRQG